MTELVSIDITFEEENAYTVDLVFEEIEPYIIEIILGELVYSPFSGFEWIKINSDITAQKNKGYIVEQSASRVEITLSSESPDPSDGYTIRIAGRSTNGWRILPPVGGEIIWMDESGINYLDSELPHDSVELLNISPGIYMVISSIGNINYSN